MSSAGKRSSIREIENVGPEAEIIKDSSTIWVLTDTCLVSKVASAVLHGKQKYLGPLAAESRWYKPASAENIWRNVQPTYHHNYQLDPLRASTISS